MGVNQTLAPSPAWPVHEGSVVDPEPLLQCSDSWKSAQDHPDIVDQLIAEELQAGFIELVPGGLSELQESYIRTAVGKLGAVLAEGRSPRLVVDSSISNVTSNTIIPNHMMLPRISDVLACAPVANGTATDDTAHIGRCQSTSPDPHRTPGWRHVMLSC